MVSKRRKVDLVHGSGSGTVSHTPQRDSHPSSWSTRVVLSSFAAVAVAIALLMLVSPSEVGHIGSNRRSDGDTGGADRGKADKLAAATAVLMRAAARGDLVAARAVIEAVPDVVNTRVRQRNCLPRTP